MVKILESYLTSVFNWAEAMEFTDRNVMRKAKSVLGKVNSDKPLEMQHFPSLPYQDVPKLVKWMLQDLRKYKPILFIILNASRKNAGLLYCVDMKK